MEWCRFFSDTKGYGELTPAGLGVDGEDGTFIGEEGRAEVRGALEVSEDTDELDEVALVGISIMGSCHDDREEDFRASFEQEDELANNSLILRLANGSGVCGRVEEVLRVWRPLSWEGLSTASCEDLEDRVEHRSSEGTGDRIKVESNAEVVVHGGFVEDPRVALVELEDGLVPESTTCEDSSVVNVSVEDHYQARVVLASPEELARIS